MKINTGDLVEIDHGPGSSDRYFIFPAFPSHNTTPRVPEIFTIQSKLKSCGKMNPEIDLKVALDNMPEPFKKDINMDILSPELISYMEICK